MDVRLWETIMSEMGTKYPLTVFPESRPCESSP